MALQQALSPHLHFATITAATAPQVDFHFHLIMCCKAELLPLLSFPLGQVSNPLSLKVPALSWNGEVGLVQEAHVMHANTYASETASPKKKEMDQNSETLSFVGT